MGKIIQWNCRGLRANYNELLLLQQVLQPAAFCLKELRIDASYSFPNRQYNLYSNISVVSTNKTLWWSGHYSVEKQSAQRGWTQYYSPSGYLLYLYSAANYRSFCVFTFH
jgi:exonuclease III